MERRERGTAGPIMDGAGACLSLALYPNGNGHAVAEAYGRPHVGYHATRLRQLAQIDVDEASAEAIWHEAVRHRRELGRQLARDVGMRVALLDYLANIEPQRNAQPPAQAGPPPLTDPLTGLLARGAFEPRLTLEVERAAHADAPLSLLLLGIEGLDAICEEHGGPVGGRVLQRVATIVLHQLRAADLPCRSGAGEFGLILRATPAREARQVARRIASEIAVRFRRDPVDGRRLRIHSVTGVATMGRARTCAALLATARRALETTRRGRPSL